MRDLFFRLVRTTVESHEATVLTLPIGGVPLRQYDPKRIGARSGLNRPGNGGNRRLRTKPSLELQALMTVRPKVGEKNQINTRVA